MIVTGGILTAGTDPNITQFTPEEIEAGVREAARFGKKVACHAQGADGIARAVAAGATSIEHGFDLRDETIEQMLVQGTWLVPTLSITAKRPGEDENFVSEKRLRFTELHRSSVRRFHAAGGRIAMGTDTGFPYCYHGDNARELAYMTDVGMSPLNVLRAATASGADLCGFEKRGRIAPGNFADLLVVNGDPFENIGCVADRRHHDAVYKNGHHVYSHLGTTAARPWPTPFKV
jgi:imidazolonepropionase-like amidohydrolase